MSTSLHCIKCFSLFKYESNTAGVHECYICYSCLSFCVLCCRVVSAVSAVSGDHLLLRWRRVLPHTRREPRWRPGQSRRAACNNSKIMKTSEYIIYLSDNTYIIYIYIIIIHNYIYILVCVLFFFSRFFWNLFKSWNISTSLSLQSEVILEGFISHVCYPLRVCQAEMNTVHVLSSGPPSCHLGVGMSIKVKRWFEVGPN